MMRQIVAAAVTVLVGASIAAAQVPEGLVACPSQQDLEQVIATDGELVPEGCRVVNVVAVERNGHRVCALDLGTDDEGVIDALRDVAVTTQWWMDCDELAASVE